MKHLKSSLWDRRWIFERSMTARDLVETLVSLGPQGKPYPEKALCGGGYLDEYHACSGLLDSQKTCASARVIA